ncbi:MAG: hypothetical protein GQ574_25455 [Crocinitomix sp.]|nr:hypothetical protein [Crocinitomix sp.]
MKSFKFLFIAISLFMLSACRGDEAVTSEEKPDLTLVVGEELKLNGVYLEANKVFESDNGLASNIDISNEEVVFGGGLIYKGENLEVLEEVYKCTAIDEKTLEFKLIK